MRAAGFSVWVRTDLEGASHQGPWPEEKPPCHEQPPDDTSPQNRGSSHHEKSDSCGLAQTAGSEGAPTSKFVSQPLILELPSAPVSLDELATALIYFIARSG